ncbi:MAG: glycosyltransferase [Pseudomonadota bacterium]
MKVGVCVRTYNHEAFVEQAGASALGQKTDFDFEVVVGEDGSSDWTQ